MRSIEPTTHLSAEGRLVEGFRANMPWTSAGAEFDAGGSLSLSVGKHLAKVRLESVGPARVEAPNAPALGNVEGWPSIAFGRAGVREWYVNGGDGLRQWFRIDRSPNSLHGLTLRLAVSGGETVATSDQRVELRRNGHAFATYSGIRAWDALGRALPARLGAANGRIELHVDDFGAQYPVTVDPVWSFEQKLVGSQLNTNGLAGGSVDVSGDRAVVGAQNNTGGGVAFVFVRDSTGAWTQEAVLTASDRLSSDLFGQSVAMDGDRVIVGAPGKGSFAGATYIFRRDNPGGWSQEAKLTASDGAASAYFGWSVGISGTLAVVGAQGASPDSVSTAGQAYAYVRSGTVWTEDAKLKASDKAAGDAFGYSVAIDGSRALIGAQGSDPGGTSGAGAAYVFDRTSPGAWTQSAKLFATDKGSADNLGWSVDLSGDYAIAGAYRANPGGTNDAGAAYVFARDGLGTWAQQAKLVASDKAAQDNFGLSVAIHGRNALVGSYRDDVGANLNQGSAYLFRRDDTNAWPQMEKFVASDGAAEDNFGSSVALSDNQAVVGAWGASPSAVSSAGAAYVWVNYPLISAAFTVPWRTGGKPVDLTISLEETYSRPLTVSLSSNTAALSVPATAVIPAGQSSINVTANGAVVSSDVLATVTVGLGSQSVNASVDIRAARVGAVSLSATDLWEGQTANGVVTLNGPAPTGGFAVSLTSSDPAALPVISGLVIPEGQTRGYLTVTAQTVASDVSVGITGAPNYIPKTATLTVHAGTAVAVALADSVAMGATLPGTVTLTRPAGAGGQVVALSYGGPITGPASVTVAAGETVASFDILASSGNSGPASVTATLNGGSVTDNLRVVRPVLLTVEASPTSVTQGSSFLITATLESPAPASGVLVTLTSSKPTVALVPATLFIAAGETSASTMGDTGAVNYAITASIVGRTVGGGNRGSKLTVTP